MSAPQRGNAFSYFCKRLKREAAAPFRLEPCARADERNLSRNGVSFGCIRCHCALETQNQLRVLFACKLLFSILLLFTLSDSFCAHIFPFLRRAANGIQRSAATGPGEAGTPQPNRRFLRIASVWRAALAVAAMKFT